jgi:hypothetical protein
MDSLWANLIIQLGIAGLVVFAGFKIAILLINRWSQAESERTKQLGESEVARTQEIAAGFRADTEAHREMASYMNQQTSILSRLEGKFDAAFDLTPVRGIKEYAVRSVEVAAAGLVEEGSSIPEPRVVIPVRKTPLPPSATEYGPTKRPKTHG